MDGLSIRISRRELMLALFAARMAAQSKDRREYPSEWRQFIDPATDFPVIRLTDPAYSSTLPAYYGRAISRDSGSLLFCCDRGGSPQVWRMDLRSGATRQLTDVENLDGASITFLPDGRSLCYFAGRTLYTMTLAGQRQRGVYSALEPSVRGDGLSVTATEAFLAERRGERWSMRAVTLARGASRTVLETAFALQHPIPQPQGSLILYRNADEALWLVDRDGKQNRRLELAPGRVGPANWSGDGKTILYLSYPQDRTQLNTIREYVPETDQDKLVCKTSQFVHFGGNRDGSVFVGASRNAASPAILLTLRTGGRELILGEHRSSDPESVAPRFAPNAQRIYFQTDRQGKPALYCIRVENFVEKLDDRS